MLLNCIVGGRGQNSGQSAYSTAKQLSIALTLLTAATSTCSGNDAMQSSSHFNDLSPTTSNAVLATNVFWIEILVTHTNVQLTVLPIQWRRPARTSNRCVDKNPKKEQQDLKRIWKSIHH